MDIPIFINCRDRCTDLARLVEWLERAGHERITLIDNDSTYEPMVEYLERSPHHVERLRSNAGSRALWLAGLVPQTEFFVYSDPDILPIAECPMDAVQQMRELLESMSYQSFTKAGLGLYLDDLPPSMPSLPWERDLVCTASYPTAAPSWQMEPGVFSSLVDTTFAVYRPASNFVLESLRLGFPFQARHSSWYVTPEMELSVEDAFYLGRAEKGAWYSSWASARAA